MGRVVLNAPLRFRPVEPPLPQRKRLPHTPPSWVKPGSVFFITICCAARGANSLALPSVFPILELSVEHYVASEKWWCHIALAMPDHFHALLSFPGTVRMDKLIRDWKRFIARSAPVVWQNGFFDHRLRSTESFDEKAHYIRMNPVRAGLSATPADWPYVWPR